MHKDMNNAHSQIVWGKTTKVGCAMSKCATGASIWVCRYGYDSAGQWFMHHSEYMHYINARVHCFEIPFVQVRMGIYGLCSAV